MGEKRRTMRRRVEAGVTLIELMIATMVLAIGLIGLAKLFALAALNTSLAVNESQGIADAQRLIEAMKIEAANNTNGVWADSAYTTPEANIVSSTYDSSSGSCPLWDHYFASSASQDYKMSVWVIDNTGTRVVGSYAHTSDYPPGFAQGS